MCVEAEATWLRRACRLTRDLIAWPEAAGQPEGTDFSLHWSADASLRAEDGTLTGGPLKASGLPAARDRQAVLIAARAGRVGSSHQQFMSLTYTPVQHSSGRPGFLCACKDEDC